MALLPQSIDNILGHHSGMSNGLITCNALSGSPENLIGLNVTKTEPLNACQSPYLLALYSASFVTLSISSFLAYSGSYCIPYGLSSILAGMNILYNPVFLSLITTF